MRMLLGCCRAAGHQSLHQLRGAQALRFQLHASHVRRHLCRRRSARNRRTRLQPTNGMLAGEPMQRMRSSTLGGGGVLRDNRREVHEAVKGGGRRRRLVRGRRRSTVLAVLVTVLSPCRAADVVQLQQLVDEGRFVAGRERRRSLRACVACSMFVGRHLTEQHARSVRGQATGLRSSGIVVVVGARRGQQSFVRLCANRRRTDVKGGDALLGVARARRQLDAAVLE